MTSSPEPTFLEKYLVVVGIKKLLNEDNVHLHLRSNVLGLWMVNLRNRPLTIENISSFVTSTLTLYYRVTTGLALYPFIPFEGSFYKESVGQGPFVYPVRANRENYQPPSPEEGPAAPIVAQADSRSPADSLFLLRHPEKADLGALRADPRNHVHDLLVRGAVVIRVFSPIYSSEKEELENKWRVSDYTKDGRILTSVVFSFGSYTMREIMPQGLRKRKEDGDQSSTSLRPAAKRMRV